MASLTSGAARKEVGRAKDDTARYSGTGLEGADEERVVVGEGSRRKVNPSLAAPKKRGASCWVAHSNARWNSGISVALRLMSPTGSCSP